MFVDPFLLVVTLVMSVLLIIGNLYFVAKFAHPADSAFGSSTAIKGIIVRLGQSDSRSWRSSARSARCCCCPWTWATTEPARTST